MSIETTIRVTPRIANDYNLLLSEVCRHVGKYPTDFDSIQILKKSIDSRRRETFVDLKVRIYEKGEPKVQEKSIEYRDCHNAPSVIVVGSGPAGLFAALELLEGGLKPILIERGDAVENRRNKITELHRNQNLDPDTNYCYGEGGAGTYSDGKLFTRSTKRGDVGKVLSVFVEHGADSEILYEAHPHLGSECLPKIVAKIRQTIMNHGGEVHFNTLVDGLIIENGQVTGVNAESTTSDARYQFHGPVILATGHSAVDVYRMLDKEGIGIQSKGIAVGVRLEHPQDLIDRIQYKNPDGRGMYLPPSEYSFVTQVKGRGVYSFCMCPGGVIVPSMTEQKTIVVNGMSSSTRSGAFANAAFVVELHPEDLPSRFSGKFGMLDFTQALERRTWDFSDGSFAAPAQLMADFTNLQDSVSLNKTSYTLSAVNADLNSLFPSFISYRLREAFKVFGRSARGFLTNDAMLLASETRTSSPIRIVRDPESLTAMAGLYPCGEGAGYAGGIVSSALDGINSAQAVLSAYR